MNNSSDEMILIDFKHSLKTIPITNETIYMTRMYRDSSFFRNATDNCDVVVVDLLMMRTILMKHLFQFLVGLYVFTRS